MRQTILQTRLWDILHRVGLAGQFLVTMAEVVVPEPQACKKCHAAIFEGHAYELGDDRWHIHCFKCSKCDSLLGCNSNFLVLGNGLLICSSCLYNCKQCGKKIDDLAILTGDQAYCSSCFRCRVCKLKIEDLRYARTSKGLFCMACHEKLLAKKKRYDQKRRQMAQLEHNARPDDMYAGLNGSSGTLRDKLLPTPPPATPSSFGDEIEEVNDSDDELNMRRARERLERLFDAKSPREGSVRTLTEEPDAARTETARTETARTETARTETARTEPVPTAARTEYEPTQTRQTQAQSQSHFAHLQNQDPFVLGLDRSTPDLHPPEPRLGAGSPLAKINRQARVVEADGIQEDDLFMESLLPAVTTPKKNHVGGQMTLPPPRAALPEIPATPREERGLGLDLDMRVVPSTPTVTNLEQTIDEETPPLVSRRPTMRDKILRHKRLVSGGLSKFALFQSHKDERGHARQALEGSVTLAFTTPPLPLNAPGFEHVRLPLDSFRPDANEHLLEMRLLKMELGQLEQRRNALAADVVKLVADKLRLAEQVAGLQKQVAADQQTRALLQREIELLEAEHRRLAEESTHTAAPVPEHTQPTATPQPAQANATPSLDRRRADTPPESFSSVPYESLEEAESKATFLRFWRKPRVVQTRAEDKGKMTLNAMIKLRSTTLLDSFVAPDHLLFAATIQQRATHERLQAPFIVTRCIEEVERRGLESEGVYRLSGSRLAVSALCDAFDNHKRAPERVEELMAGDINAVTGTLKRYLHLVPDPLIPFSLYDDYIRVGTARDKQTRHKHFAWIMSKLPPANKHVLYLLGVHLCVVERHAEKNRMTFKNLSLIFAPTMVHEPTGDREMVDMGARNDATEFFLTNFHALFAGYRN